VSLQEAAPMLDKLRVIRQDPKGRIAVPALLWFAGVPFGLVLIIWFFFFRG
jgi:hypothetical protein